MKSLAQAIQDNRHAKRVTPDIVLSSGRTIRHTREPNGAQLATPTTGYYAMTDAEFGEYARLIRERSADQ